MNLAEKVRQTGGVGAIVTDNPVANADAMHEYLMSYGPDFY